MILKNLSILLGKELQYKPSCSIQISKQKFHRIQDSIKPSAKEDVIDCEGLIAIPGFINAHTHIGDSIAKDVTLNKTVDEKIHPVFGAKPKILKKSNPNHLSTFIENTCRTMLKNGITTFVDFREGGLDGVELIRKATSKIPIRAIILGRVENYNSPAQIRKNTPFPREKSSELTKIIAKSDGLGISGANENSDSVLGYYSKSSKLRAIHAAETKQSVDTSKKITRKSEVLRALRLKPHFLVHMTYASNSDLNLVAKKTRGIVICPRANAALAEGIPNIFPMIKARCTIAIGTDNVMINSPDMFREMDYLWKVSMGINKKRIDPRLILKMATTNASSILHRNIGIIERGRLADLVLIDKHAIDLEPMHNPYASIVHRASESAIRSVLIGGNVVHGEL